MTGFDRVTRAFRHRNYRLFFGGQSLSLIGTWITRIATSWLVYRLTGSELLLGVVGFCGPISPQILSMLQSLALAGLTFSNTATVRSILALQVVQGVINAFDTPARQAFVVE